MDRQVDEPRGKAMVPLDSKLNECQKVEEDVGISGQKIRMGKQRK